MCQKCFYFVFFEIIFIVQLVPLQSLIMKLFSKAPYCRDLMLKDGRCSNSQIGGPYPENVLLPAFLMVILDLDLTSAGAGPRCHAPAPAGRHFLDDLRLNTVKDWYE